MTIEPRSGAAPALFPGAGAVPVPAPRGLVGRIRSRREHRDHRAGVALVETLEAREKVQLRYLWHAAAERVALGQRGGQTLLPRVEAVHLGPPVRIVAAMPPGLTLAEVRAVAPALAEALDVHAVRFRPLGRGRVEALLLASDPLAGVVPFGLPVPDGHVLLGVDESGEVLSVPPANLGHCVVQGQTRSGKSVWTYSYLAQLAGMAPLVRVAGVDPSGLTLRPFGPDPLRAIGTADPAAFVEVLGRLVAEMDARMSVMPEDRDVLPTSVDHPLLVVVCEEWAGVTRMLADKEAKEARALLGRLLAEGAKVGIRVLIIVQRADVSGPAAPLDGFARAQASTRLSFRVDSPEAVRMLHAGVGPEVVAEHATAAPGTALLTGAGVPLVRIRGPYLSTYSAYVAACRAGSVGPSR